MEKFPVYRPNIEGVRKKVVPEECKASVSLLFIGLPQKKKLATPFILYFKRDVLMLHVHRVARI